jgi:hypothetical protein
LEALRLAKALLALLKVPFPAVSDAKAVMEELVGFPAWNLEVDKAFARGNGLLALTAVDDCSAFHGSPPELCLAFPVGQLAADHFQVVDGFL